MKKPLSILSLTSFFLLTASLVFQNAGQHVFAQAQDMATTQKFFSSIPYRPTSAYPLSHVSVQIPFGIPDQGELDNLTYSRTHTVRTGVGWGEVETSRGHYDFTVPDQRLSAFINNGMTPAITLSSCPAWETGCTTANADFGPWPDSMKTDFTNFVVAMVQHYHDAWNVRFIEVLNEPDMSWVADDATMREYGAYLTSVADAVHTRFPDVWVTNGGLAFEPDRYPSTARFLQLNAQTIAQKADVISYHWYSYDQYTWAKYSSPMTKLSAINAYISPYATKQYNLNEMGADTVLNGWNETDQAANVTQYFARAGSNPSQLLSASWLSFRDTPGWGPGFERTGLTYDTTYGHQLNQKKSSYYTYLYWQTEIGESPYIGVAPSLGSTFEGYIYNSAYTNNNPRSRYYVVWNKTRGATANYVIPDTDSTYAFTLVTGMSGANLTWVCNPDHTVTVPSVGYQPVYILEKATSVQRGTCR